jgi:macrolide transport system ATP-binding/permease protein
MSESMSCCAVCACCFTGGNFRQIWKKRCVCIWSCESRSMTENGCAFVRVTARGVSQIWQSNLNQGEELYGVGMGMVGEPGARCAFRAAAVVEDSGIYGYRDPHAGAGDWGECGYLYAGECGAAEEPAGGRSEGAGAFGRVLRDKDYVHEPDARWLYLIGRIKPGTALAPLQQKLSAQLKQSLSTSKFFSSAHDRPYLDRVHVPITPGGAGIQNMQLDYRSNLHLLQWIAGLVLLIACANIANLLLVRGMGRKTEMSLRTALGAARIRIVRQLLTESLVLAVIGGISALAVSYGGAELLLKLAFPSSNDVPIHATPSLIVQGFAIALSLVTGVLFGVAPAWLSARTQPADALRGGSRTTAGGVSVLQRALVVMQAALSLVLLVGAGLFAQSLSKLEHFDMKLDAANRYIIHFDPQSAGYSQAQLAALYQTIEDRFHQIPGMVKVGLSTYTPMESYNDNTAVQIQGQPNLYKSASYVWANSEYFDSVGTHVVMGRGFGRRTAPPRPRSQ